MCTKVERIVSREFVCKVQNKQLKTYNVLWIKNKLKSIEIRVLLSAVISSHNHNLMLKKQKQVHLNGLYEICTNYYFVSVILFRWADCIVNLQILRILSSLFEVHYSLADCFFFVTYNGNELRRGRILF